MILIPKPKKRPWIKSSDKKIWGKPEHQKIYKSYRWRRLREDYLIENPECVMCGRIATVVDHIKPITQGGSIWRWDNLQSLCKYCHNSKTAKESNR